jgi:hypothetical protein
MKHLRRSLVMVTGIATSLIVWASVAGAQGTYPPPPPTPGPNPPVPAPPGGGALAFTGSDLTLLWVGLAALVVGIVLFVATRRRASLRRQASLARAAA